MVGPTAPNEYFAEANQLANQAKDHLGESARRSLIEAEREARALDDNHIGTEHMVLGVLDADTDLIDLLAAHGVTCSSLSSATKKARARRAEFRLSWH